MFENRKNNHWFAIKYVLGLQNITMLPVEICIQPFPHISLTGSELDLHQLVLRSSDQYNYSDYHKVVFLFEDS